MRGGELADQAVDSKAKVHDVSHGGIGLVPSQDAKENVGAIRSKLEFSTECLAYDDGEWIDTSLG